MGDVVLYVNSEEKICYGLITGILTKNRVTVKTQLYGKPVFLPMHTHVLNLLFRSSEWEEGLPLKILSQSDPNDEKINQAENLKMSKI